MTWENQLPALFRNSSFEREIDRLFDEAIFGIRESKLAWEPDCNVYENDQTFVVGMALPGIDVNDIDVRIETGVLFVNGERKSEGDEKRIWYAHEMKEGAFACSFQLPSSVDPHNSTATYKHGVLTITFSKREEAKPRRIMIECQ